MGQIVSEILAQLCSDDSIQILLNLSLFITLGTESNLEGFVWSHQSITGLISQIRDNLPHNASFWQEGLLDVFLSEYLGESHNFTNSIFYDVTL